MHHIGELSNVLNGGVPWAGIVRREPEGNRGVIFFQRWPFGAKTAGVPFRPHFVFWP